MSLTRSPIILAAIFALGLSTTGCSTETTPTPAVSPIQALIGDLASGGLSARLGGEFSTEPIGGTGTLVCVGPEVLQVYEFDSVAARITVAGQINPQDPSIVGGPNRTAVVDWIGQPHFWQRDRLVILSVGGSPALVAAITRLLGRPFAEGQPGGLAATSASCATT